MKWHEKSRSHDLFFCTNPLCNVITFRVAALDKCPKCEAVGSVVRYADTIRRGEHIEGMKQTREDKTVSQTQT